MKFFNYLFLSLALLNSCGEKQAQEIPPLPLPVITLSAEEVPFEIEFVGQVFGFLDIPIRARVDGYLEDIHFDEGLAVKKGQMLYSIDAQPFEEQVAAQRSEVARAQTNLAKAKSDLDRIKPLAEINAVSKAELDGAEAAFEAAQASLDAANANLRMSQIQLSYTRIKAPISGVIGKTQAKIGEYVGREPNPVILNTVSRTDSILVEFFINENEYLEIARRNILQRKEHDQQENPSKFELILSDNSVFEYPGRFKFANREIDPSTGSLLIQTTFPNPDNFIKPGQFGKIRVTSTDKEKKLLIPQRAVKEFQGRYSVFTVGADNSITEKPIEIDRAYRDYWVVSRGVNAGDKIIQEGLLKVRPGQVIDPQMVEFESKAKG